MSKAAISSNGHIAIPKAIGDLLNLTPGTQVAFDVQGEQLVTKRMVSGLPDWRTMRGMVSTGPSLTDALEHEHLEELNKNDDRLRRL